MMKFSDTDIPQTVYLDNLPLSDVESYHYIGTTKVKDIAIDLYADYLPKTRTKSFWIYGFDANVIVNDGYAPVFEMPLTRQSVGGIRCWHPDYTQVDEEYQGMGIMSDVYMNIMKILGIKLMAGTNQSPGAVKLWAKLISKRSLRAFAFNRTYGWTPVFNKRGEMITKSEFEIYENETTRVVVSA